MNNAQKIVIDCSVAAKWLLPEHGRLEAMGWLDRWTTGEVALIAPALILAEFASLLSKRVRRKEFSANTAYTLHETMVELAPKLYNTEELVQSALEMSCKLGLSFWDCVYLALAKREECPFLTADNRLAKSGGRQFPQLIVLESPKG